MILARFRVYDGVPDPVGKINHYYWVWNLEDFHLVMAYEDNVNKLVSQWPNATGIDVLEDNARDYSTMAHYL